MNTRAIALMAVLGFVGCQGVGSRGSATPGEKAVPDVEKAGTSGEKAAARAKAPEPEPTRVPTPEPILVPAGTSLVLVFGSSVSSAIARAGDAVTARLGEDVTVADEVLLPKDSEVRGHVVSATRSGKVKGRAQLQVEFDTIELKGRSYTIDATSVAQTATSDKGRDAKIIGGAAGAGAIIGGIADGGSGALKGVLIGGAAGTGGVLLTRGKEVVFEQGSRHRVKLEKGLRLR